MRTQGFGIWFGAIPVKGSNAEMLAACAFV